MNKLLTIFAVLFLMGCSDEEDATNVTVSVEQSVQENQAQEQNVNTNTNITLCYEGKHFNTQKEKATPTVCQWKKIIKVLQANPQTCLGDIARKYLAIQRFNATNGDYQKYLNEVTGAIKSGSYSGKSCIPSFAALSLNDAESVKTFLYY